MCKSCGVNKCSCGPTKVITERGIAGKSALPIPGKRGLKGDAGDSSLPIKNTAFVSKNGNDATALVERLDKPYATIQAAVNAIAAAYPGKTVINRVHVVVFSGKYDEDIILKEFVDMHFFSVTVNGTLTDNNLSMTGTASGEYTNIITGNLRLYKTNLLNKPALFLYQKTTKLLMYCDFVGADVLDTITVLNGFLTLHCNKIFQNDTSANYNVAVELGQGFLDADYTFSRVAIHGADIYRGAGGKGALISFSSAGVSKNQTLELHNCRIKNTQESATAQDNACIGVGGLAASNAKILLYDTILYSFAGNSIHTETGNTSVIKCYKSNMSNVNHGGGGTNTFSLGAITVNAAVEAEF